MTRPVVVSIVNHKGGCLKTSLTANLGAGLARSGKRVLLLDLDAQQNLTQSLIGSVNPGEGELTLHDAVVDESGLDHLIRPTAEAHLDIIPCTEDFAGADLSLVGAVGRESILRSCLEQTKSLGTYDLVLIDNPPSISLVVANSLVASDYFLVPCSAEYLPMVGLTLLGNSVAKLQKVAPRLSLLGVVITMFAKSERICQQVERMLRKELGGKVLGAKIRVNTKAKAAPSVRKTIFEYESDPQGRGTQDYTELAAEFLQRLESLRPETHSRLAANE
jgi:chromosome partitioning protein